MYAWWRTLADAILIQHMMSKDEEKYEAGVEATTE